MNEYSHKLSPYENIAIYLGNKMAATGHLYSLDELMEDFCPNLTEEEISQVLYYYEMVW